MKIALSAETTCDLGQEMLEKTKVHLIPYTLVLGEEQYLDGEKTPDDLFAFTKETGKLPRTAAINAGEYKRFFEGLLEDNDAVIHVCLSAGISSSCDHAMEAASELKNVYVIDSKSLSSGEALLLIYASELIEAGKGPEEIVESVKERIPHNKTTFVIDTLEYLHKGGRCSALTLLGANLLKIKPEIIMPDGKMTVGEKFRGPWSKCVAKYVDAVLTNYSNPDKKHVYVTYTTAPRELIDEIKERLVKEGFENVHESVACSTITCHCGPNTLGVLLINDGPHEVK